MSVRGDNTAPIPMSVSCLARPNGAVASSNPGGGGFKACRLCPRLTGTTPVRLPSVPVSRPNLQCDIGDVSLTEFISMINSAQQVAMLPEPEFLEMLKASMTGKALLLLLDWIEAGESIESILHLLSLHFDQRTTPAEARRQLYVYKIPKTMNLAEGVAHIMDLAQRVATQFPPGPSQTALYNLEATNAIFRALPSASAATAMNNFTSLSARMQRPATISELSRSLNLYRQTIDTDIKNNGWEPKSFNNFKKLGKNKVSPTTNAIQASLSTNAIASGPPPGGQPQGAKGPNYGQGNNQKKHKNKQNRSKGKASGNDYCSLCGAHDHVASQGCPNMRDNNNSVVSVFPTQST